MGHGHGHGQADRSRLRAVLAITLAVLVLEVVGFYVSGSLALLADAGHMLTDSAALILALAASHIAALPASQRRTFGFHRAEILAALANSVVLLGLCSYLLYEAVRRLVDPREVDAGPMLVVALVGLVANLVGLGLLRGRKDSTLNMRAAYLEVLTDTLGSVAVVVGALVLLGTDFQRADSIVTIFIAILVFPRAVSLLRESVEVLLEATPRHIDVLEVQAHLGEVAGVVEVHDLHVWTIASGLPSLSAHVVVEDEAVAQRGLGVLLDELTGCVSEHFDVTHCTFQVEPAAHRAHEHWPHEHWPHTKR